MRRRSRLVGRLWRWHRRIGLVAFVFLLLMSVSGVVLNHGNDLGLDRSFVSLGWLRGHYGDLGEGWVSYAVGAHWIMRGDAGVVFMDTHPVGHCEGSLAGAVAGAGMIVVACAEELLLLTSAGDLVDSRNASGGLPIPLDAIALDAGRVLLRVHGAWRSLDTDTLAIAALGREPPGIVPVPRGVLPETLRASLHDHSGWLNWERVLLDLHSGRFFGRFGETVVDAAGLFFAALALSGVTMWWLHHRARQPRP